MTFCRSCDKTEMLQSGCNLTKKDDGNLASENLFGAWLLKPSPKQVPGVADGQDELNQIDSNCTCPNVQAKCKEINQGQGPFAYHSLCICDSFHA